MRLVIMSGGPGVMASEGMSTANMTLVILIIEYELVAGFIEKLNNQLRGVLPSAQILLGMNEKRIQPFLRSAISSIAFCYFQFCHWASEYGLILGASRFC